MSADQRSSPQRFDRRIVVAIVAMVLLTAIGFFFLFEWANDESPWLLRVALVLLATSVGYRLGREICKRMRWNSHSRWIAVGFAGAGLANAGYFGMIRPALHDRERNREFAAFRADGESIIAALDALASDSPDAKAGPPTPWELGQRDVESLRRGIAWMERYESEQDRYTASQQRELHDEFRQMAESSAAARATLAKWIDRSKKK